MQPTPLANAIHHGLAAPSAREPDGNGWYCVPDNPLSKAGIFDYHGAELPGAPDTTRVYRILRPPNELADPECIASFRMVPLVDEHTWLGADGLPAEQKGVHGATGEGIHFDGEYLRGPLKIFSTALASLIESGKRELSCGYRCVYDWTAGVWNGEPYDAVQREIRGNHVALVGEGRMGPDVAVLDRKPFVTAVSFDSLEYRTMPDNITLEQLAEGLAKLQPLAEQVAQIQQQLAGATSPEATEAAAAEAEETAEEVIEAAVEVEEAAAAAEAPEAEEAVLDELAEKEKALDSKLRRLKPHAKSLDAAIRAGSAKTRAVAARSARQIRALDARAATAADSAVTQLASRDTLARRLFPHIGVFDHSGMTASQVAAYGAEKLGCEPAALDAFLSGRESVASRGMDERTKPAPALEAYLNPSKE